MNPRASLTTAILLTTLTWPQVRADETPFPAYERAELARKRNDPDAAGLLRRALELRPDHIAAHVSYQRLRQSRGEHSALRLEYERIFSESSGAPWAHYVLGRVLEDLDREIELYRAGIEKDPRSFELRSALAEALFRARRLDESRAEFRRALALRPGDRNTHSTYLYLELERGQLPAVTDEYRKRVDQNPDSALSHHLLGLALGINDRVEEALPHLERSVELEPKTAAFHAAIGILLLKRRQIEAGSAATEKALELDPYESAALRTQGMIRAIFRQDSEGEKQLHEAVRLEPDSDGARQALAYFHIAMQDWQQARSDLRGILRRSPNDHSAFHVLAQIAFNENKYDLAIDWSRKAIAIYDRKAEYHGLLAAAYRASGRTEESLRAAEKATELESRVDFGIRFGREGFSVVDGQRLAAAQEEFHARALAIEGKYELAKARYRKAIRAFPKSLVAHRELAEIHARLGELDDGVTVLRSLKKALADDPSVDLLRVPIDLRIASFLYDLGRRAQSVELMREVMNSETLSEEYRTRLQKRVRSIETASVNQRPFTIDGVRIADCTRENACMSQSLFAVLKHWKLPHDLGRIREDLAPGPDGPTMEATLRYLGKLDHADVVCGIAEEKLLKSLLREGYPLILISWLLAEDDYTGHASVVTGYDDAQGVFRLEDSNWFGGSDRIDYSRVEGRRFLVVAPPEKVAALRPRIPHQKHAALLTEVEVLIESRGDIASGLRRIDEAIELKPDNYLCHIMRGLLLEVSRRIDEALASYERAVELGAGRGDIRPHSRLAGLQIVKKDFSAAEKTLQEAISIEWRYPRTRLQLTELYLYHLKNYEKALSNAEWLLGLVPQSGLAHYRRAEALIGLKLHDEALASLKLASARGGPPNTWWYLAILLRDRGEFEASLEALGRLRTLVDNDEGLALVDRAIAQVRDLQSKNAQKRPAEDETGDTADGEPRRHGEGRPGP